MFKVTLGTVAVLLLALGPAGIAGADFIGWDNEQLTVAESHDLGLLHDQSHAEILAGASVAELYAFDDSSVAVSGGTVGDLKGWGSNAVDISGGSVSSLHAYGDIPVNISGGFVDRSSARHLNISGGDINSVISPVSVSISGGSVSSIATYWDGTETIDISGGSIVELRVWGNATPGISVSGGSISTLDVACTSIVSVVGGTIGELAASDDATIDIHALDFRLGPTLSLTGNEVVGQGFLSILSLDGKRWAVNILDRNTDRTILIHVHSPGDADMDGDVDLDDFAIFKASFGHGSTWGQGDFDADGDVDLDDFTLLKQNFGTGTVPEPATLSLLLLAAVFLPSRSLIRRR